MEDLTKPNGDVLEGTLPAPVYPDPALNNVNSQPMEYAEGDGNPVITVFVRAEFEDW